MTINWTVPVFMSRAKEHPAQDLEHSHRLKYMNLMCMYMCIRRYGFFPHRLKRGLKDAHQT